MFVFLSRLGIAQDSVDWDNWTEETRKAADLFMRLEDDKLKDCLMEKANNNANKFAVEFIKEQYKKMKAGARSSWQPVSDYGKIDTRANSISNRTNSNKNTNNNKS